MTNNNERVTLNISVVREGNMTVARLVHPHRNGPGTVIATVSGAACDLDEEVLEDFQALSVKVLAALMKPSGCEPISVRTSKLNGGKG